MICTLFYAFYLFTRVEANTEIGPGCRRVLAIGILSIYLEPLPALGSWDSDLFILSFVFALNIPSVICDLVYVWLLSQCKLRRGNAWAAACALYKCHSRRSSY